MNNGVSPDDLFTMRNDMEEKLNANLSQTDTLRIDLLKIKGEIDRIIGGKILSITTEMRGRNYELEN